MSPTSPSSGPTIRSRRRTLKRKAPRNKFEQKGWDFLKKNKIKFGYEEKRIPYVIHATYVTDFTLPNGVILEFKGYYRPEDKRKMKSLKQSNPHLDIRMVFQKATEQNIRWCEKHGFPWSEGQIPKEWLT